jgi:hypothetical protein
MAGEDLVHVADVGVAAATDGIGEAWYGRERQPRTGLEIHGPWHGRERQPRMGLEILSMATMLVEGNRGGAWTGLCHHRCG